MEANVVRAHGGMPFYHPPYEVPIYALFSFLPYRAAYLCYIGFNMILLLAIFYVARPAFSFIIPWWQPRPGLMLFLFVPLIVNIVYGQDSLLVLLFCCLSWRRLSAGKDMSAGCCLALALFKFQFILPIAILLAIRRGWRFSTGFAITAAAALLTCFAMVGRSGMAALFRLLTFAASAPSHSANAQQTIAVGPLEMPNLTGLFYAFGGRFLHHPILFDGLSALVILGVFAWCAYTIRRYDLNTAFSLAILCALLMSTHSFIYDVTLALLPLGLIANRIPRYIVAAMFFVPVILVYYLGQKSFFLRSLPLLAMLVQIHISTMRAARQTPSAATASAV